MPPARFELIAGTGPHYTDQRSLDRIETREEAIAHANRYRRQHPAEQCFVFEHITPKTRLLVHHTLNA